MNGKTGWLGVARLLAVACVAWPVAVNAATDAELEADAAKAKERVAQAGAAKAAAGQAGAEQWPMNAFTVEGRAGFMGGYTKYHIGGVIEGLSWASELEFPLDSPVGGAEASFSFDPNFMFRRWTAGIAVLKNLDDPSSDMKDYDWIPDGVMVGDTSSDTKLDATMVDAYLKGLIIDGDGFWAGDRLTLSGVGGYMYQNFDFEEFGLHGWYNMPGEDYMVAEEPSSLKVLTYEITYNMLYAGGEAAYSFDPRFHAEGQFVLGLVMAEDKDDHVLRGKVSTGDSAGWMARMRMGGTYYFNPDADARLFLRGLLDLTAISTEGEHTQHFLDGHAPDRDVDLEIDSSQVAATLALGCGF